MKALTLTQPWATLMAIGAKTIETRSWSTGYRGPLAIHAARAFPRSAFDLCFIEPFRTALYPDGYSAQLDPLPRGEVVATCNLLDCLPVTARGCLSGVFQDYPELDTPQERAFGDYSPGRWAWIIEDVKMLAEPIPAKGALSLWEWVPSRTPEPPAKDSSPTNTEDRPQQPNQHGRNDQQQPNQHGEKAMSNTPGPWEADPPAAGFSAIRQAGTRKLIFALACPSPIHGDPEMPEEEKFDNLALIAAAPELLKVVEAFMAPRKLLLGGSSQARIDAFYRAISLAEQVLAKLSVPTRTQPAATTPASANQHGEKPDGQPK